MGWMKQLYQTYENLKKNKEALKECSMPLVPVSHTVQTAHLEIILDESGKIRRMEEISKDEALTICPCTENSICRTSKNAPHMLYDNLKNVAGDAADYFHNEKYREKFVLYCSQLKEWCDDPLCPRDVHSIYNYVIKGNMIEDIIRYGVLKEEDGKLKWNGRSENKPADAAGTFVRFCVEKNLGDKIECNQNLELINAYITYDAKKYTHKRMCFVSGKVVPVTYKHPAKIRYSGDAPKLISSNDTTGYTYRGRFQRAEDAFAIGYEISHKAHSALRWLIANQGIRNGEQTIVAWAVNNKKIPSIFSDTYDLKCEIKFIDPYEENIYTPLAAYAKGLALALRGCCYNLGEAAEKNEIVIMILEAATPGRLSIVYYREFTGFDYLERIESWHTSCVWNHDYKQRKVKTDEEGTTKKEFKRIRFTGAPSIDDIIFAAYGARIDDKLKKHLVEILTACITDKKKLPQEMVLKAVQRISNPQIFDKEWEYRKSFSITCALIRKYYFDKGVEYDMALDYANTDRSYLFGRVLAYAERIESYAQYLSGGEGRVPNARKLRNRFRMQPAKALVILDQKLEPYISRLYAKHNWMYIQMQEVIAQIHALDYMDNSPLSPLYLLGYACQITELNQKKEITNENNNKEEMKNVGITE